MEKKTATKKAAVKKDTDAGDTLKKGADQDQALMDFFVGEIKDVYWAEKHLTKALPKMKKAATSATLADAIGNHLEETKVHVTRLEEVFGMLGKKPQAKKCDAMEGITKEGEGILEETEAGTATRDVGIIMGGQKIEHYEIATYGGLVRLAQTLGLSEVANILAQTLDEEKQADRMLTEIAETSANEEAADEE